MSHGTIQSINASNRYKIVTYRQKFYIFDIEKNVLIYFFPFINYLFPRRLHEISQATAMKLIHTQRPQVKMSSYIFPIGLSILISSIIKKLVNQFDVPISTIFLLFLVIISILLIFILRVWISYYINKQSEIKYTNNKIKAFLIPHSKYIFRSIGYYCFWGIFYSVMIYAFSVTNKINLIIFMGSLFFLFMLTITNYLLFPIENERVEIKEIQ